MQVPRAWELTRSWERRSRGRCVFINARAAVRRARRGPNGDFSAPRLRTGLLPRGHHFRISQ